MNELNPVRIFAALGPGDVVRAYGDWLRGIRTPTETSITYSSQTFDFLRTNHLAFWVVSSCGDKKRVQQDGNFIENRPKPGSGKISGLRYHWREIRYAFSLWRSAAKFRATHALIDSGTTHWFALIAFSLAGIRVIPNLHNVYWPVNNQPEGFIKRIIFMLDRFYFSLFVREALGVSPECGRQLSAMSGGRIKFFDYRIQYSASDFTGLPRIFQRPPFRILFVGRIEENKGIFDLLKICESLHAQRPGEIFFDVCGTGSALETFKQEIQRRGLNERIVLHGKLPRRELIDMYGQAFLVVVPTRSNFCEGLPGVCVEAMLARRPVVTSSLSNALDVLKGSLLEANQDDAQDYARRILQIVDNPSLYQALSANGNGVEKPFLNTQYGLSAALQASVIGAVSPPQSAWVDSELASCAVKAKVNFGDSRL
jgi:glycogen synthase